MGNLVRDLEEGAWSVWLYDLLNPRVDKLVVCNPRKNALLKDGNKSDRIDAGELAELLRGNQLKPVYHSEAGVRMLRELSRSYLTIVKDLSRVMNRLKQCIAAGRFLEREEMSIIVGIERSRWPRSGFGDLLTSGWKCTPRPGISFCHS